ncbi:decaprenyl-phosphate phosphoribosyltransferase [Sphaerospermopsis aphanizomenoides BCCUSP55]|uniref:decaprenyl-phosphate phosphoribosyltransferase n=1 Tax=Sphaerospermopsis aphanizomenoides TaxID=459663 RepID=UPI000AA261FF|nr:decaprenyl-phosphate phosphoribosyltransferase [Sphaerospermopsis aphanizomenoides]MBK1986962.1 decaprenyl-phosphate phosphoribosyltransferase [Sphaerospermopsis aphanizomenoides BCCUSP55]
MESKAQKLGSKNQKWPYLMALRPRQWTKNLVVFAAPLFAFSFNLATLFGSVMAFVIFCLTSSSFYLINDIADVEADRQHPVKCQRPIAAGSVSIPVALGTAVVLLGSCLTISWWRSPYLGATITAYALLQVAYNLRLKRMVILDICAIATGFILRALAGGVATGITLSPWFVLCTAMLALFLGIEKRKAELRLTQLKGTKPRAVLRRYSLSLLSRMENVVTTGTVLTYALWSAGPNLKGASTSWMLVTLPFVLYGVFRYQLISDPVENNSDNNLEYPENNSSERPEEVLLKDLPILVTVISWIITCFLILLCKHKGIIQ